MIPRDPAPDATLALLRDGYTFAAKRFGRLRSDAFHTRLILQRHVCMAGEEAARLFYDNDRFMRHGVAPARIQKTLFGVGGVQGLDGEAHRHRKQMFMDIMRPDEARRIAELSERHWRESAERWERVNHVVLFDEVEQLLCRTVCEWAGVPLPLADVGRRTNEMRAMIEAPAAVGLRHLRGRRARKQSERWAGDLVERVRTGALRPPEGAALTAVATHRELDGRLLDTRIAAVELLNVLRPTVAVARFITFAALALHSHPECRARVEADETYLEWFVHEVRRYYPFFPLVVARVRDDFEWRGERIPRGRRVLLDLYATDHDARFWPDPEEFRPERFRDWNGNAFDFIPQGGGDHFTGHRCPGEGPTIELMKVAVRFLTASMDYEVPRQDLSVSLSRIPAVPKSRFVIAGVRRRRPPEP